MRFPALLNVVRHASHRTSRGIQRSPSLLLPRHHIPPSSPCIPLTRIPEIASSSEPTFFSRRFSQLTSGSRPPGQGVPNPTSSGSSSRSLPSPSPSGQSLGSNSISKSSAQSGQTPPQQKPSVPSTTAPNPSQGLKDKGAIPSPGLGQGGSGSGSGVAKKSGGTAWLVPLVLAVGAGGGAAYWWQDELARITPTVVIPDKWPSFSFPTKQVERHPDHQSSSLVPSRKSEGVADTEEAVPSSSTLNKVEEGVHQPDNQREEGSSTTSSTPLPSSHVSGETEEPEAEASVRQEEGSIDQHGRDLEKESPLLSNEGRHSDSEPLRRSATEKEETNLREEGAPSTDKIQAEVKERAREVVQAINEGTEKVQQVAEEALSGVGEIMREESRVVGEPAWTVGQMLVEAVKTAEQQQAEKDKKLLEAAIKELKDKYEKEKASLEARAEEELERAERLNQELGRVRERVQTQLQMQLRVLEIRFDRELREKAAEAERETKELTALAEAKAEAAIAEEKVKQLQETEKFLYQVEAFTEAFYDKSEEARKSYGAHKLAMCTFLLQNALTNGAAVNDLLPLMRHASSIDGCYAADGGKDDLVDAVTDSIPERVAVEGALTRQQLLDELGKVRGSIQQLSMLPLESGGLLAFAAARLAASLKILERGTSLAGGGVEAALGRAEALLTNGELEEAANELTGGCKGLRSEPIAQAWAQLVLDRAAAEQALRVLQAHATAIASSLV